MLKVYGFARVNKFAHGNTRDLRVLWALEEIGLPYDIVGIDHPNHDLDSAAYRAQNPFGQIPMIDDDGVVVTESGAIVLYLARKTGTLMPRDLAGEAQVLRWSIAALNTIEVPVLTLMFVNWNDGKGTKPSEALEKWATMRLGQLDGWLAGRQYIATDDFTVAAELIKPYANILAYRARCTERPAWKKTLAAYCERVEAA
jgi:glutathione S-transferase